MILLKPVFIIAIVAVFAIVVMLMFVPMFPEKIEKEKTPAEIIREKEDAHDRKLSTAKYECSDMMDGYDELESYYLRDQVMLEYQSCMNEYNAFVRAQGGYYSDKRDEERKIATGNEIVAIRNELAARYTEDNKADWQAIYQDCRDTPVYPYFVSDHVLKIHCNNYSPESVRSQK